MELCGRRIVCVMLILGLKLQLAYADYLHETVQRIEKDETKHNTGCGYTRRVKRHDNAIFPPSRPSGSGFGKALRFFGKEIIQFTKQSYITPREFTVELWIKPEGGQQSPVNVLAILDYCSPQITDKGWRIGLQETGAEKNLRVFFSLRAARSSKSSTIFSPLKVEPNVWIHVAATYDGKRMKLYINQAKVAVSTDQKGHVFAKALMQDQCEALEAGGNAKSSLYFRGTIDEIKLWSIAKSHRSISQSVFSNKVADSNSLILYQGFDNDVQENSWVSITKSLPETVKSTIPSDAHVLSITKPPCGITVCDNPEIIRSYVNNTHLRTPKVIRLRIINVMEDDGTNPIVTHAQIQYQARVINATFRRYGISWDLHEVNVKNSSLRRLTVLSICTPSMVGDMQCNSQCDFPITGRDGGDCVTGEFSKCDPSKRGNGKCDPECNIRQHGWDYGDCCNPKLTETHKTCFDPTSPHRAYLSIREYKTLLNFTNHRYLNVYFAQCGGHLCKNMMHGLATFPWAKTAHGVLGGVIVNPSFFGHKGNTNDLIHELGHMLGLWHVFHGVSKTEMTCADECYEHFPSMELGDLCSDTNPTPMNNKCRDPSPYRNVEGVCGRRIFKDTPYKNYMSYSNDACTDSFTPQQVARMHCYIDLIFQSWQPRNTTPSFIPLPPRVTSESQGKVTIAWIPPLGSGGENAKNMCHKCRENSVLHQYAVSAFSPMPDKPNGYWASHQAIGAPDVDPCVLSPNAWSLLQKPQPCPDCYIELGFKEAVVPSSLSIWVNWHSSNGISDIQLWHEDHTFMSLGNATAQCDTPLTMAIKTDKKVAKVRIYVQTPYTMTSIDAVQLTSSLLHRNCLPCKPLKYHINRSPPFTSNAPVVVRDTRFTDETIKKGINYQYTVEAVTSSGLVSPPSPVLQYTPKRGFCGDGRVDKETGEECDDGNVRDGDGCNVQCKKEDVFHCKGHPSLCYRHDGDGICEDFERRTSIKDCGFFTPDGFQDQWAESATSNPEFRDEECPEKVVIGPPDTSLVCKPDIDHEVSWSPCGHSYSHENYWLDVTFKQPVVPAAVVLYIASDGVTKYSEHQDGNKVEVEMIDTTGQRHPSGSKSLQLSCKANPALVPIQHDMTKPFYYSQKVRIQFRSFLVAIAGVALRSLTKVDPVAIEACGPDELFNPRTRKCHKYPCKKPSCKQLTIPNANIKCEGLAEGQHCLATCINGYRPRKPFTLLCLDGKWKGYRLCKAVNCGPPKIPNAKADCSSGYSFGSTCSFRCIADAKLNGKDTTITCEDDGKWSVQQAFCVRTCAPPDIPLNSVAIPSSHACIGGNDKRFFPGMACKYHCKLGTKLQTKSFARARKTLKVHCTKEGTWISSSKCVPITCTLPPPYVLYWYNCTKGGSLGSVCTFSCPNEKPHEVKCGYDSLWDRQFTKCTKVKTCGKPVTLGVVYTCDDEGIHGVCKARCENPDYDAVVKGQEDIWNVSITCTTKLTWDPEPSTMTCMKKCRIKDLGDGWCEERHNNLHCRWDGGDCCISTSRDRVVRHFSNNCGVACDCKDPNAKENIRKDLIEIASGDSPSPDDEQDDDDDYGGDSRLLRAENSAHKTLRVETKQ